MYQLHGFAQSGNTFKVAFLLRHLGLDWQAVHTDFFGGETRQPAWRAAHNAMGEIPVLVLPAEEGGRQIAQSGVALRHLARRHAQHLLGQGEVQQDEVLRWILFDNHKFTAQFAAWRFLKSFAPNPPDPAVAAWLRGRIDAAFAVVEGELAQRDFIAGPELSIADFSLSAYLFYPPEESGYPLAERCPHTSRWLDRLRALPGWADPYAVLPGERLAPRW